MIKEQPYSLLCRTQLQKRSESVRPVWGTVREFRDYWTKARVGLLSYEIPFLYLTPLSRHQRCWQFDKNMCTKKEDWMKFGKLTISWALVLNKWETDAVKILRLKDWKRKIVFKRDKRIFKIKPGQHEVKHPRAAGVNKENSLCICILNC